MIVPCRRKEAVGDLRSGAFTTSTRLSYRVRAAATLRVGPRLHTLSQRQRNGANTLRLAARVGVAQKFLGLAALSTRSEHGTPLIVDTLQEDGQEQAVVDVWRWAIRTTFGCAHGGKAPQRRLGQNGRLRRRAGSIALAVGFFVFWELACVTFGIKDLVLPRPSQIILILVERLPAIWAGCGADALNDPGWFRVRHCLWRADWHDHWLLAPSL